ARADRFAAMKRALLLAAFLPLPAFAYNEAVHAFITRHALPLERPVLPPTQDDLRAFRAQFWVRASEHPRFERRYPTIHDFDAWPSKEFLIPGQGHAHAGLVDGPLSVCPDVLKQVPWGFAVPPTAHAYGAEFVQVYADLAALAAQSRLPSAVWLQAALAGAAFHHLEDLCNQI